MPSAKSSMLISIKMRFISYLAKKEIMVHAERVAEESGDTEKSVHLENVAREGLIFEAGELIPHEEIYENPAPSAFNEEWVFFERFPGENLPEEIIEDVRRAVDIGITMVHLHARDAATGKSTYKAEAFGEIIAGIRSFCEELIICVSLSGRCINEFEKRAEPLQLDGDLKPDMGSLTLSSLNFNHVASMNSPEMIQKLANEMKSRGILAELEAFDAGMINYAKYLEKKG